MNERIINFNPGPAAIPLPVLKRVQAELLNLQGTGMSILEISHRSKPFDKILENAILRTKRLLGLDEKFTVLFVQGGASLQFAMAPMNLAAGRRPAYILTDSWSTKALKEAELQGLKPLVAASSEDKEFSYIPTKIKVPAEAAYLHLTANNTIRGTQFKTFPQAPVPLVADMTSEIMSRPFDPKPFGLVYAGTQKNLGPAGCCLVVIRQDMLERSPQALPTMLRYPTYAEKNSLYNTPNCFAIYVAGLVMEWLEEEIGGLEKMAALNEAKAKTLYDALDRSVWFYKGTAEPASRSVMNVTFHLPSPELEAKFVAEALGHGLGGLKGHRSVGGIRASIFNAIDQAGVDKLAEFMSDFARWNK